VPCAPILNLPQVFEHRQVVHRGMKTHLTDAHGHAPCRWWPTRCASTASAPWPTSRPPGLDQHGDAIRAGQTWRPAVMGQSYNRQVGLSNPQEIRMDMKTSPLSTLADPSLLKTDALIGGEWVAGRPASTSPTRPPA
jgi:hypothetical protein